MNNMTPEQRKSAAALLRTLADAIDPETPDEGDDKFDGVMALGSAIASATPTPIDDIAVSLIPSLRGLFK